MKIHALDGAYLTIESQTSEKWGIPNTCCSIQGALGSLVLQSSRHDHAFMSLARIEGMAEVEQYSHPDGTLTLHEGARYEPETFEYYGQKYGVLWRAGDLAVTAISVDEGRQFLLDYFAQIRVSVNEHSPSIAPAGGAPWHFTPLTFPFGRFTFDIPGAGVLTPLDEGRAQSMRRSARRSTAIAIGTVYTEIDNRGTPRLMIQGSSSSFLLTLIDGKPGLDVVLDRLSSLTELTWTEP